MPIEFSDETSPVGSRDSDGQRGSRRIETESIDIGTRSVNAERGGDVSDEVITIGARGGRALSDNAKRMLANIDKHGTVEDRTAETPTAETVPGTAVAPKVEAAPVAAPVATPAPAAVTPTAEPETKTDPAAEHIARADKLAEHNRRLVTELETMRETMRKKPTRGEMSAREKALDEAERAYISDPVAAIRRLAATALGIDDPKAKEVDDELVGLYQDLTERELSVQLDPAQKAMRESARNRRLFERDKRDRAQETASAAAPVEAPEDKQTAETVTLIGSKLTESKHADKFPLMMALSTDLDGMKPEELLWRGIKRGIAAGELDPKSPDDVLIETVSKQIETYYQNHYQALADKVSKARPQTSTAATPTQASPATESKADPQGNGVRTITNASASVAPATPPAKKTEPTTETPPKYRNEAERRRALAAKHFGA